MFQVWWWSRIQGSRLNNIKCRPRPGIYSLQLRSGLRFCLFYQNETLRRITDIAAWNISTCFIDEINKIPTENQQDPGNSTLSRPAGWWDYISKYHTQLTPALTGSKLSFSMFMSTFICDMISTSSSRAVSQAITESGHREIGRKKNSVSTHKAGWIQTADNN